MKFRYAFQQVVDLKNTERTQAEWVLSAAMGRLNTEQHSLHELEEEKERMQQELCLKSQIGAMTISNMRFVQHYVNHLNQQISKKNEDVKHAQEHVEQRQQILTGKIQDEKVWTEAREKAFQIHMSSMRKKEQEQLDEMASVRFLRSTL